MSDKKRPILTGFMVLDDWAEDYSDWSGSITGPVNPRGANMYWLDPISMIEKRAYDDLRAQLEAVTKERDDFKFLLDHASKLTMPGECDTGEALVKLVRQIGQERDFATQQWRDWNAECDALSEKLESYDANASQEIDRLKGNWEAAEKEVQSLKLERDSLAERLKVATEALEFYAAGSHFNYSGSEDNAPENPSGEPSNWKCGGADGSEFTVETGEIAREALARIQKDSP